MSTTVAILNSNEDVLEMLRLAIEHSGAFNTVTAHVPEIKRGQEDFLAFLAEHDPAVIIYDLAPPYRENWTFLKLILDTESVKHRHFVLTTANKRLLQEAAGGDVRVLEISEKPYDITAIVDAVKRSVNAA